MEVSVDFFVIFTNVLLRVYLANTEHQRLVKEGKEESSDAFPVLDKSEVQGCLDSVWELLELALSDIDHRIEDGER
jgi:hypothetical protein